MIYHLGLYLHMAALILVGGGSIGAVLVERQLWKKIEAHSYEAKVLLPVLKSAALFIFVGLVFFLASGLTMLYSVKWAYLSQPWFMIKVILFLMLPVRGGFIGRPTMARVGVQIQEDINNSPAFLKLKKKMNRFHTIQYLLVAVIIFLVIFKI